MKVEELIQECDESQEYLEQTPVTTEEFVKYLEYVEAALSRMDTMEAELDYCKELHDIMEEFHICVDIDDMSNYLGLSVIMGTLRQIVDKKNEERSRTLEKFNVQLNKDISNLISEVGEIKDECLVSKNQNG